MVPFTPSPEFSAEFLTIRISFIHKNTQKTIPAITMGNILFYPVQALENVRQTFRHYLRRLEDQALENERAWQREVREHQQRMEQLQLQRAELRLEMAEYADAVLIMFERCFKRRQRLLM